MLAHAQTNKWLTACGLIAVLAVAVSCSSNTTSTTKSPTTAAQTAATKAATAVTGAANTGAAAGSAAAGTVQATFQAPGGSAPWASVADGCRGAKAPAGADALKASDTGVSTSEIKLGTTFALSGPASAYAPIVKVLQDCFDAVNADGGIYGRKLSFILDDGYDPAKTVPLTKQLVEQDKIFADVTPLGTATNAAVVDYMNIQKVPQFYVASGASKWGSDVKNLPWTMGFQPDYIVEGQNYATYIQQNFKGKKVGVLRQNDDYGQDYLTGLTNVLGKSGTADNPIVDVETYAATDTDVSGQITNLKNKGAEVFVLVATPVPAGLAIKAAVAQNWKPSIILNSVGIDTRLNDLAGGSANLNGIISNGYYHTASETSDPSVQALQQFLQKNDKTGCSSATSPSTVT